MLHGSSLQTMLRLRWLLLVVVLHAGISLAYRLGSRERHHRRTEHLRPASSFVYVWRQDAGEARRFLAASERQDAVNLRLWSTSRDEIQDEKRRKKKKKDDKDGGFLGGLFRRDKDEEEKKQQSAKKRRGKVEPSKGDKSDKNWLAKLRSDDDRMTKETAKKATPPRKESPDSGTGLGQVFQKRKPAEKQAEKEATAKGGIGKVFQQGGQQRRKEEKGGMGKAFQKGAKKSPEKKKDDDGENWAFGVASAVKGVFNSTSDKADGSNKRGGDNSTNNVLSAAQNLFMNAPWSASKEQWVDVFPKTRIMPGETVPVTVAGLDLLVIASLDGRRLYSIANSCPHLGTPLETGRLVRLPVEGNTTSKSSSSAGSSQPPTSFPSSTPVPGSSSFTESDVARLLQQDGCEDCIVCPLHRTAFALESGQVRGEWCPYPPVIGKAMGTVKKRTAAAVFGVRTKGKNVQVRINTPLVNPQEAKAKSSEKKKSNSQQSPKKRRNDPRKSSNN